MGLENDKMSRMFYVAILFDNPCLYLLKIQSLLVESKNLLEREFSARVAFVSLGIRVRNRSVKFARYFI